PGATVPLEGVTLVIAGAGSTAPRLGGLARGLPAWSVVMPATAAPAPMAGLPGSRASVRVGPPVAASGSSIGSALLLTAAPGRPAAVGLLRTRLLLLPVKVGAVAPLPLVLATRSVMVGLVWPRMLFWRTADAVPEPGLVLLPPLLESLRT